MPDPFNTARILRPWVEQILAAENNDERLEAFANETVSAIEGQTIVGTSNSWDGGRDGRGFGPAHGVFVLATLRTDTKKARADATRLKETKWKIKRVYYVNPRVVSDTVLEKHSEEIRSVVGKGISVDPIGGVQLADLVTTGKAAESFKKHYAGELASIKSVLAADSEEPECRHLELALSTFGANNTQELRVGLGTRLILGLLEKQSSSLNELAGAATVALGVNAFSESTVHYYCDLLTARGDIELKASRYEITGKGRDRLAAGDAGVAANALSGREAVRKAVEESLGATVPDQQWTLLWGALQKALAHAFYVRGKQILELVSTLLQGDTSDVHRDVLAVLADDVLKSVINRLVSIPQRASMLRAFQDAFLPGDKHGAFEWLAGVAGRFAATCTLGLPTEIAGIVADTLRRIRCFLDTDWSYRTCARTNLRMRRRTRSSISTADSATQ